MWGKTSDLTACCLPCTVREESSERNVRKTNGSYSFVINVMICIIWSKDGNQI
jgi:hypothetical protein